MLCLVLSLFFALTAMTCAASEMPVDIFDLATPAIKRFTDENGLPSNSIMTLDHDNRGRLWIGTQDGAAYYNGHKWHVVNMPARNLSNYIFDILHASDGSIWFATDGNGVHRLFNGEWTSYAAADGLPGNFARVLLETEQFGGQKEIWVGTRDGLARYDGQQWKLVDLGAEQGRNRLRSLYLTKDSEGSETVWAGTYGGLVRLRNGETLVFDTSNGLPNNIVFTLYETSLLDGQPKLLAGTESGVAVISGNDVTKIDGPPALQKNIRSIVESESKNGSRVLWIGTDGHGLAAFRDAKWHEYGVEAGLPGETIFALADAGIGDGSVWVSLLGQGLVRLEKSNWKTLKNTHGLPHNIVFSFQRYADEMWFATFGGGLASYNNKSWNIFSEKRGFQSDFVYSLYAQEHADGKGLYAGTEKGVLYRENNKWVNQDVKEPALNTETWDFLSIRENNGDETLWIGTSKGLVAISNDVTKVFNTKSGLPDDRVRVLHQTKESNGTSVLWAGTYGGGLARFYNGEWQVLNTDSGLPSNRVLAIVEHKVNDINKLYVGTSGGIAVIDPQDPSTDIKVISSENTPEMLSNYVLDLVHDGQGRLYTLTNRGVTRFSPSGSDGSPDHVYTFTTEDGLPSNECVSGSGFLDANGKLYVGTVKGVAVLDTLNETASQYERAFSIENFSIAGKPQNTTADLVLGHRDTNLVFDFPLLANYRESGTRYRSQLIGLDPEPTSWGSEPHREISYLPAGSYTLNVWARDHNGKLFEAPSVSFIVRPAWWLTWWAMILYLLIIVGIVSFIAYLIYQYRVSRLIEIERVRTRIATDLHDDIGSSLSQIAILSEVMSQKIARDDTTDTKPLAAIAETSRDLMTSMSDIVWAINPKRDHLTDLIQRMRRFAIEVLSARDIDLVFDAPENADGIRLDLDTRRQIHLIFKEVVNNCVRHSHCSGVRIVVKVDPAYISLSVTDNGKGFDIDKAAEGNGLASIATRAKSIGGSLEIISDLNGTSVNLQVPNRGKAGLFRHFLPN